MTAELKPDRPKDFIREIIDSDLAAGRHQEVVTRFPPEPNGYLHIGHAKSICLNFGIAKDYGGACHLRFDDTNPSTEDIEYVEAIERDVRWLGFDWQDKLFYASDYYERLYSFAEELVAKGRAYVCDLDETQISEYRGTLTEPGKPSPFRERSPGENLELLRRMRGGEFPDGSRVLRAKIDMASPNMKLRDPLLYRIKHAHHYRTGDSWCLYPLYDFAHPLSDAIEGITHSICTLEFENNRDIYDWLMENLDVPARPHQYEFARLNLTYTVMSKRKLLQLVEQKHVSGWDDPRMPTIAGLRRRGITPEAMRAFATRVGVAKNNSTAEIALFEHTVRDDLNTISPRALCVLRPLKVVIENYPEAQVEELDAPLWPHDVPNEGSRKLAFSRELYLDRNDFSEAPPKDFFRLSPGKEVRLRHAYVIRCERVVKDAAGEITELRCSYDPTTRGGDSGARKVKGTIHWVSAAHAVDVEVRVYDRLFSSEFPGAQSGDPLTDLNPESLLVLQDCKAEAWLGAAKAGERFQFEREGFYFVDPVDAKPGAPVFNRIVALKDTWAKLSAKTESPSPARALKPAAKAAPSPVAQAELSPSAKALFDEHGLSPEDARALADSAPLSGWFEAALGVHKNARAVASWIVNELPADVRTGGTLGFGGRELGELVAMIDDGTLSGAMAKKVLAEMLETGRAPRAIVEQRGLKQIADPGAIEPIVDQILAENADAVARYRSGNKNVLGALTGMILRESKGQANPKLVNELLTKKLA
ncbi:MAG: glutamine--tRNA ligase/YqeY domain fusion protein [Myxococcales bacterium]|nr:glutamine--tRNA ligase/YqeY domain fusion protein [Myxococcales bacterium]